MSIPKTGSRRIVVDGVTYRWRIRPRPTNNQGDLGTWMTVAVQQVAPAGSVLVVAVPYTRPDASANHRPGVVHPSSVAEYVRQAIRAGWHPAATGKPFNLDLWRDATPTQR
jgi:hypothetical protein